VVRMQFCRVVGTAGIALVVIAGANAQSPQGNGGPQHGNGGQQGGGDPHGGNSHHDWRPPLYQRHGFDWNDGHDRRRDHHRSRITPQVSSAWFQRPYPYHLDYYKMRWGGSYAPYFGNLYGVPFGTPQVVNGGFGYGGWGPDGGLPPQGYEWMEGGLNPPVRAAEQQQAEGSNSHSPQTQGPEKSENLPPPEK
jgi:hypothetical protein